MSHSSAKRLLHPPLAALGEDGLQVAFKQGAGVLEVLFGVGFGGGDAVKRFVEDADDPLLFGERGKRDRILFALIVVMCSTGCADQSAIFDFLQEVGLKEMIEQEPLSSLFLSRNVSNH